MTTEPSDFVVLRGPEASLNPFGSPRGDVFEVVVGRLELVLDKVSHVVCVRAVGRDVGYLFVPDDAICVDDECFRIGISPYVALFSIPV